MTTKDKVARSRKDMVEYLEHNSRYVQYVGTCLFAFYVKATPKFDFDSLYDTYAREVSSDIKNYDKAVILQRYEEMVGSDDGVRQANGYDESESSKFYRSRMAYESIAYESAQNDFIEGDIYNTLRSNRKPYTYETIVYDTKKHHYSGAVCTHVTSESTKTFGGNQGGYAVYREVDGHKVVFGSEDSMEVFLYDVVEHYHPNGDEVKNSPYVLPFKELRRLYNFHRQMSEYLTSKEAEINLTTHLASIIFGDIIGELRAYNMEATA